MDFIYPFPDGEITHLGVPKLVAVLSLFVMPPNSNMFSDWRKTYTLHVMGQNSLTPWGEQGFL